MPVIRYAGYPTAPLFESKTGNKMKRELLWGDWVKCETAPNGHARVKVRVRGEDGFMNVSDLQEQRLLEVVFVDVGQGDGCLVVTPNDKHIVIDAGVSDNMYRFLRWRYAGFRNKWTFDSAILTHPDKDHYNGFKKLFAEPNVFFDAVYHNGFMERKGSKRLGPTSRIGGVTYHTDLIETKQDLKDFLSVESRWKRKLYPTLLNDALTSGRVKDIRMLSPAHSNDGFLPGYEKGKKLSIEVLGPVVETDDGRRSLLRRFKSNDGKTKNGHSVILRLKYGNVRVLLGGDLNSAAENFLLEQYTGLDAPAGSVEEEELLVAAAREHFEADIAKACHHGSGDFTDAFLTGLNAAATVVSSGDEESHSHPRSDTLGALGKHGRGWRSIIASTELTRSTKEHDPELVELLKMLNRLTTVNPDKRAELVKQIDEQKERVTTRNVTVYGSINLRSDGDKAVVAYKLEKQRKMGRKLAEWDVYPLERVGGGPLVYTKQASAH